MLLKFLAFVIQIYSCYHKDVVDPENNGSCKNLDTESKLYLFRLGLH